MEIPSLHKPYQAERWQLSYRRTIYGELAGYKIRDARIQFHLQKRGPLSTQIHNTYFTQYILNVSHDAAETRQYCGHWDSMG